MLGRPGRGRTERIGVHADIVHDRSVGRKALLDQPIADEAGYGDEQCAFLLQARPLAQIRPMQKVATRHRVGSHRDIEAVEGRSEEHTSELQSLMRISYAVFCLKKKKNI